MADDPMAAAAAQLPGSRDVALRMATDVIRVYLEACEPLGWRMIPAIFLDPSWPTDAKGRPIPPGLED